MDRSLPHASPTDRRRGAAHRTLLAVALLAALVPALPAQAATQVGYAAQSYGYTTEGPITGEKPESKLWYHAGSWWAAMLRASDGAHTIHRLQGTIWADTGVVIDTTIVSKEDVLSLGNDLYVVSRKSTGGPKLRRFSYGGGAYTPVGAAIAVPSGGETLTLARDTVGTIWVTWEASGSIRVARLLAGGTSFGSAFVLPVTGATGVNGDDISSVLAFTDSAGAAIGVMWSNQNTHENYFAVHRDGAPDGTWTVETALSGPLQADDHINLKTYEGRVFAVVKTSVSTSTAPLIKLLVRSSGGSWSNHPVALESEDNTRPITMLQIDPAQRQVYVFMTLGSGRQAYGIGYKKTSLDRISFPTQATVFIQGPNAENIDDPTSMKANATAESGIVVMASSPGQYWWNRLGGSSSPPPPNTAPTADDGAASTVQGTAVSVELVATDAETCELAFSVVTPPADGSLGVIAGEACSPGLPNTDRATVTYTPAAGFAGSDSFTFKANDGAANSNTATVTLTVTSSGGGGGGGGGIALRAASSAANSGATTLTLPTPSGVAVGDLLLASVDVARVPAVAAPAGWTLVRNDVSDTKMRKATYYRVAVSGEPASHTWAFGRSQPAAGGILAYTGVDTADPVLAASAGVATSARTSITAPSVTTTVDGAMLVGLYGISRVTTITPPGGMAERWDLSSPAKYITSAAADVSQTSAGATGDKVATAAGSAYNIGHLVALRPSP